MDTIITIVIAVVLLSLLVFIHEGGHYLTARAFGVRVTEFMLGLPGPRVGFRIGETKFGVTAIPLGGYAAISGMIEPESSPELHKRCLAISYDRGEVLLEQVAEACGVTEDEAYIALEELSEMGCLVRPQRRDRTNIYRTPETADVPMGTARPLYDVDSFYQDEIHKQYFDRPFWKRSLILCAGPLMNLIFALLVFIIIYSIAGVDLTYASGEVRHITLSVFDSIRMGLTYIGMTIVAIAGLFNPATAGDTISNSTSIVGIAVMSKSALDAGVVNLLMFSAIISISLGLMNLLPIPPLDGGRFLVEIIQKISGRAVPVRIQNYISFAGMALFILLFVVMLDQDIQRFIFGNWG